MPVLTSKISFILLADDDDDDTMLFVEAAEKLSSTIKVCLANDGEKLLALLEKSSLPDIIFLDLNMPCKNGLECLKVIRSNERFDGIPVIMYSTSHHKKDVDSCFSAGANYYVVKPYDFEDIIIILRKLFSQLTDAELVIPSKEDFVINTRKRQ
jgi:CheY-like chemotaxis protein